MIFNGRGAEALRGFNPTWRLPFAAIVDGAWDLEVVWDEAVWTEAVWEFDHRTATLGDFYAQAVAT
jgi:hypothetical protein